ncbi:hypothetical protein EL17_08965 [Anditalea andensis]|uniref:Glycoside hydrolase n=2 Tax=Anditalea andensis TaxID=1048983 RepID=A0A074L309_9BACT|nr:hypothetical protein EL17_08965 [Anditalea andensis]
MGAFIMLFLISCEPASQEQTETDQRHGLPKLKISDNQRFFATESGEPFFWLGDTAWLLFGKLDREETEKYLDDRKEKGFNIIQIMTLHTVGAVNAYGDSALVNQDVARPLTTEGTDYGDGDAYDFWDHVDFVIDKAEERGIYVAMVPIWGSNVRAGHVDRDQVEIYGKFLSDRYGNRNHIVWLNGGDVPGSDSTEVWNRLGETLRANNPDQLITFHPRGRTQSSDWFADEDWMDFHMFQSGHRRYDQDDTEKAYGEDNWRYVKADYDLDRRMPTLDGEPSYEGIPIGLHDPKEGFWDDNAVRRYGYWSVFAGAAGYTYGHSAIMQMHRPIDETGAYGNEMYWTEALDAPGASQMIHLKNLMLDFDYFDREPAQELVANQGERYDYLVATKGKGYALIYTYTGRDIAINMDELGRNEVEAKWFNPRTGEYSNIGRMSGDRVQEFKPDGEEQDGNDWVLVLTYE